MPHVFADCWGETRCRVQIAMVQRLSMLLVLDTNLDRTQTMLTAQSDFGEKKETQSSGMDGQKCVVGVERPCAIAD